MKALLSILALWLCAQASYGQSANPQPDYILYPDSLKSLSAPALRRLLGNTSAAVGRGESVPDNYLLKGNIYSRLGEYDSALACFNTVITLNKSEAAVYLSRGLAQQALGNDSAAMRDLNTAISLQPLNAILYSNRGYLLQSEGNTEAALRDYDKGISLDRMNPAIYVNKIRLLAGLHRFEESLAELNKLLAFNPADPKVYAERADIHHAMHEDGLALQDWDKAVAVSGNSPDVIIGRAQFKDDVLNDDEGSVADCNIAIAAEPAKASHYYHRSRPLYDLKRYPQVIADCDKALTLDSTLYAAYVMRGDAYDYLGGRTSAINDYEKAIRIDPDGMMAYRELAVLYQNSKDFAAALDACNRLLARHPRDTAILLMRGKLHVQAGRYDAALPDFTQLIASRRDKYEPYFLRALTHDSLHDQRSACADMQVADRSGELQAHQYMKTKCRSFMPPKSLQLEDLFDAALAKEATGDYKAAIALYDKAILLQPDSEAASSVYYNRGKAKRKLEDHPGAIADYRKALKYTGGQGEIWVSLGVSQQLMGQTDEAAKTYKKCIELAPAYPMAYYNLASIMVAQQQCREAIPYLKTALKYDPDYVNALLGLGYCCLETGDNEGACVAFKKASALGSGRAMAEVTDHCR